MKKTVRTLKQDRMARIYDQEILPIWSSRFGRMVLRDLVLPPRAMVLDVACSTGYPSLEILRRLDEQGRIIAMDPSSPLLDVARRKAADLSGKRIFFRSDGATSGLAFADEVYDLVVCNLGLDLATEPQATLREFARVAKTGGQVVTTLEMAGTWTEFYDIYREVLIKHDMNETLARLEHLIARHPDPERAIGWMEDAGLGGVHVDVATFTLLFKSSREFFFAPLIEYGPLADWKEVAGKGQTLQDVFWYIKEAIDAYFRDRAFAVTVVAGCLRGIKRAATDDDKDPITRIGSEKEEIEVHTGEIVESMGPLDDQGIDDDGELH
jgi:ubiquinone/menaquinone biosynthesis C-methylase UbiE